MVALTLDIAIVALLLVTLAGGYRLHGTLTAFRLESDEFKPMIEALDKAAERAETALGGLRQMAEDVGAKLNGEAGNTQRLLDELDFMTKRADQLADRLDGGISQARSTEAKATTQPAIPKMEPNDFKVAEREPRRRAPDLEQRLKNLR